MPGQPLQIKHVLARLSKGVKNLCFGRPRHASHHHVRPGRFEHLVVHGTASLVAALATLGRDLGRAQEPIHAPASHPTPPAIDEQGLGLGLGFEKGPCTGGERLQLGPHKTQARIDGFRFANPFVSGPHHRAFFVGEQGKRHRARNVTFLKFFGASHIQHHTHFCSFQEIPGIQHVFKHGHGHKDATPLVSDHKKNAPIAGRVPLIERTCSTSSL